MSKTKGMIDPEEVAKIHEQQKLHYFSATANKDQTHSVEKTFLPNLTLSELLQNWMETMVQIMNELIENPLSFDHIAKTFFTGDRIIYVGLTLIFISLFVYFW